MRLPGFFYLLFLCTNICAQQTVAFSQQYSAAQAREDFQELMNVMQEAQTGLYRYSSVKKIKKNFEKSFHSFHDSVNYQELFKRTTNLISITGCSHSGTSHSSVYQKYFSRSSTFFPFDIAVTKGRYYIKEHSNNDSAIKAGSRLLSINGLTLSRIAKIFAQYIDREGNNQTHLYREMENNFSDMYADYIGMSEQFYLTFIPPGGRHVKKLVVDAKPKSPQPARTEVKRLPLVFRYLDSLSTGVYTISRFNEHLIRSRGQDFTSFTDSVFIVLDKHKARNLIIDLRGNRGGLTAYSKYLFSYFIDQPYPYIQSIETIKTDNYSFSTLMTSPPEYNDTMQFVGINGYQRWINNPNLTVMPQRSNRFDRNIYILIDGNTMSAAALFASAMKLRTNAVFIGEETGGAAGGLNGLPVYLRLPHSKINITLSTAKYTFPTSAKDRSRGVYPDLFVQRSIHDIMINRDTIMEVALKTLAQRW